MLVILLMRTKGVDLDLCGRAKILSGGWFRMETIVVRL